MKYKKHLLSICASLVLSTSISANEEINARVAVDTFSYEEDLVVREARALEDQLNTQNYKVIPISERPVAFVPNIPVDTDEVMTQGASYTYQTSDQLAYHYALNLSVSGATIELDDGSIWTVDGWSQSKVAGWLPTDILVISPNRSWFSSYQFKFTNLSRQNETALVNIALGPIYDTINTHWIVSIDYQSRILHLENNTVWSLSWFDESQLQSFNLLDVVIIGVNDGWWKGSNPNVLINVGTMKYVRGNRIK